MNELPTQLSSALASRYRIEREIGRGGMATVYLAHDVRHGRAVALKVLRAELAAAVGGERFLREITLTARLDHPHILPLLDSGEAAGALFYVMPYVEGESLRDRLRRERQLPVEEALRIARDIADALAYAHSHGIVHRDIKPENILLASGHARVADFGIARAVSAAGGGTLTETGVSLGTPPYMSPEQAAGDRDVDARSDVYSLACVLYEMLTGDPPFMASTAQMLVAKIITEPPTPVRRLRPSVAEGVEAALGRALSKVPADRFGTALEFAEALETRAPAQAAEPTRSSAIPAAPRTRSERPRRVGTVVTAGVLTVLALIVLGVGVARWADEGGDASAAAIGSLVVLPLVNLTGDAEREYFVDGLHDALIGELQKISALRVISRPSAIGYRGTPKIVPQIADELGVDAVVAGTVFWAGDAVRIQVQLIGAQPERLIWADSYDRTVQNVMALLGEVTRTIADQIQVKVTGPTSGQLAAQRPVNVEAQDQYLRGRQLLYRRDSVGILGSIEPFRQAIRIDGGYAPAYAALASAYSLALAFDMFPADSGFAWGARALRAADQALELDSANAEAYGARGYLGLFASAPEGQVERDLTNAIRIKPSSSEPHGWYAQHLARLSNAIDAREAVRRALELDPVSPGMRAAAAMVDAIGDEWNRALETARQARIAAPKWIGGPLIEAVALMNLGRAEECLGIEVLAPPIQAMCMQAMGRSREAGDMARSAEADWMAGNRPPRSTMYLVWYYASSGQIEKSIEWLEREFAYSPMGEPLGLPRGVFGRALQTEGRVPSNVRAPSPRILGSDRAGEPFGSAALTEARLASPSSRASQVFTRRCCGAGDPAATGRPGS